MQQSWARERVFSSPLTLSQRFNTRGCKKVLPKLVGSWSRRIRGWMDVRDTARRARRVLTDALRLGPGGGPVPAVRQPGTVPPAFFARKNKNRATKGTS